MKSCVAIFLLCLSTLPVSAATSADRTFASLNSNPALRGARALHEQFAPRAETLIPGALLSIALATAFLCWLRWRNARINNPTVHLLHTSRIVRQAASHAPRSTKPAAQVPRNVTRPSARPLKAKLLPLVIAISAPILCAQEPVTTGTPTQDSPVAAEQASPPEATPTPPKRRRLRPFEELARDHEAARREAEAAAREIEDATRKLREEYRERLEREVIRISIDEDGIRIPKELLDRMPPDELARLTDTIAEKTEKLWLIPVLIVATIFATPIIIVAAILYYNYRKNRAFFQTVQMFVEKGQPIPSELLARSNTKVPRSDLRKGVVLATTGLGIMIFFNAVAGEGTWGLGAIPFFIGIGYLAVWWLELRQPTPPPLA
jgi:hypothetical protein